VLCSNELPKYREEEIFSFLEKRRNVLEGVCVTGGEPTLYNELPEFIKKIKALGYKVKLDTNGSNPKMLKELVKEKLVDYVAMDVKAPIHHYNKVCGVTVDVEKIKESVEFLKEKSVSHEFRTTLVKELHSKEDVLEIGKWISGAENYYLQSYQETDKNLAHGFLPMENNELVELKEELEKCVKNVKIRGVE
jgi:pyruvate formate lyase activating enzyme